jgi:hypothetical protein
VEAVETLLREVQVILAYPEELERLTLQQFLFRPELLVLVEVVQVLHLLLVVLAAMVGRVFQVAVLVEHQELAHLHKQVAMVVQE